MKIKVSTDTIANIAVVVASLIVVATLLPQVPASWRRTVQPRPGDYEIGDRADWLAAVDFTLARRGTLVMFINSTCRYCSDSMGLYARVSSLSSRKNGAVRVVAVSFEPRDRTAAYLKGYEIEVDQIVSVTTKQTKLRSTPTVLLVNRDGRIERMWRGLQQPDGEREMIAVLEHGV